MSYALDGITIDGPRPDKPTTGLSRGALGASAMALVFGAESYWRQGDPFAAFRAIAATALGQPRDDDPRRITVAITLGLLIHFAIGMMFAHGIERLARGLPGGFPTRGLRVGIATATGACLSFGLLDRLAPSLAAAISAPTILVAHALFGFVLEREGRDRSVGFYSFGATKPSGVAEPSPKK